MQNERIEQVIAAAGIPCRMIRWAKPPTAAVYAEYTDGEITDGADGPAGINALSEHTVDISVYEAVIGTKRHSLRPRWTTRASDGPAVRRTGSKTPSGTRRTTPSPMYANASGLSRDAERRKNGKTR